MIDLDEWKRCSRWLSSALDEMWSLDDVLEEIEMGRAIFWPMERSAVVTQLHQYPNGKVMRIWLAGGDLMELKRFLPAADNYAKSVGCVAIELEGRPGWERVLDGYEKQRVILVKELN
jgi:hypothetical protein